VDEKTGDLVSEAAGYTLMFDDGGAKNATFCAIYIEKRSFCQDRLGTNIGKTQKRVAFFAGGQVVSLPAKVGGARTVLEAFPKDD
jgi:hypothetical protein